jgi:hypothetical protein
VQPEPTCPLRDQVGRIRSVDDLRRAGELLARHLGLPHPPRIKVEHVPWKGPGSPIIEPWANGWFAVARWALRGRYRRSWDSLEYALVFAIGSWLESHRGDPMFSEKGTSETLIAWYGKDAGEQYAMIEESGARSARGVLITLGALLASYLVLWAVGIAR